MELEHRLALISMLLLFTADAVGQDELRSKSPFSIALSAERLEFRPGSPIPLKVMMTNTSDRDLRFDIIFIRDKELNYEPVKERLVDVQLYDNEGNSVPLTLFGRVARGRCLCFGKGVQGLLRPGESLTEEADLSKEFDIKQPGKYTIRAQRFDEKSKAMVKTEPLGVILSAAQ